MSTIQSFLTHPLVRKYGVPAIGTIVGLRALASFNGWLSQRALNHYVPNSNWDWEKEIVVVTGGSSGIGASVVSLLARRGVKVIILDVQKPNEALPPSVYLYQLDITSDSDVTATAARIRHEHGDPTVLINCAGVSSPALLLEVPLEDSRKVWDINYLANVRLIKEFLPAMVQNDHGHVVTVGSMAGLVPAAAGSDYSASKAAVAVLHDTLGQELSLYYGAKRVRTTIVLPAFVRTPILDKYYSTGRFKVDAMEPEDLARDIVQQLYSGNSGEIIAPKRFRVVAGIKGYPHWIQEALRRLAGTMRREAFEVLRARSKKEDN